MTSSNFISRGSGAPTSKLGDEFVNIDLDATKGIKGSIDDLSKFIKPNSIEEIVANNPRTDFLQQSEIVMVPRGTLTVRGTMSNKYFKNVYNGKAEGIEKFEIVSKTENVPNLDYKHTTGEDVIGQINEIILRKK